MSTFALPETNAPSGSRRPGDEPIPGYRLLALLGRGGFGEVWKCEAPGCLLKAIKFVDGDGDLFHDGAPAEDELRAIQRVKAIRHPFILSMECVEVVEGVLVIVLELADRNLADVLTAEREQGRPGIPRDALLGYLRETAEALDVMHVQHRLQHLDVKPQNLFLVADHVKVGDFGLVQTTSVYDGRPLALTARYAAPEVSRGSISEHSDQYSLAIVYQELLTGTLPFDGKNARQLLLQHAQAQPDLAALPEADRDVVARAMSKDPAGRFPSCSAFVQALASSKSAQAFSAAPQAAVLGPVVEECGGTGEGRRVCFRYVTDQSADVVRLRLGGFERQWNAQVVAATLDGMVLRVQAPRSTWQRWTGGQPFLEVGFRVRQSEAGTEVRVEMAPRDCTAAQSEELLGLVGSLLAESLRAHLQATRQQRAQERLPWRHAPLLRTSWEEYNDKARQE